MSKKLLFLFFTIFPLLSYGTDFTPQENSQIGRYQIVSHESGRLYLLDTTTGHVWKSVNRHNHWGLDHDTWVSQITAIED